MDSSQVAARGSTLQRATRKPSEHIFHEWSIREKNFAREASFIPPGISRRFARGVRRKFEFVARDELASV
ncbi:MAG: hypothetical protein WD845_12625 [Pirellulales bacterium]